MLYSFGSLRSRLVVFESKLSIRTSWVNDYPRKGCLNTCKIRVVIFQAIAKLTSENVVQTEVADRVFEFRNTFTQ
jgi:hypothetical protein